MREATESIMGVLRKNNTSYLWNIPLSKWTGVEFKELNHLRLGNKPTRTSRPQIIKKETQKRKVNCKRKVVCIETGIVYNSIVDCSDKTEYSRNQISEFIKMNVKFKKYQDGK